ncbi:hypothetical protein THIOM_002583 [Candidatus Thiomargarita nelsonii]|uniref:Uncharacterized protein n=1 Tax=Candidatus Thiomargarita nelsonii TaxID=1003181 RepID=A0A176S106_9GAMM|nr:hypothetical protein THIOM_002583 [Candidatus Thiomargarita nelsonii]
MYHYESGTETLNLLVNERVKYPNYGHECYHYHHRRGANIRAFGEEKSHHFAPNYPNQSIFSQRTRQISRNIIRFLPLVSMTKAQVVPVLSIV